MNIKPSLTILLTLFVVASTTMFWMTRQVQSPALHPPQTDADREVITALENAIRVLDTPAEQLKPEALAEVLIDHPIYKAQLSVQEWDSLLQYTVKIQGQVDEKSFGYLTAMQTKRLHQQNGARLLRAAMDKANSEQRELTAAELQRLTEQNYGVKPYLPPESPSAEATPSLRYLQYLDLKVNGDRAEVTFDTGAKNQRAILVRVNNRWYVAAIY